MSNIASFYGINPKKLQRHYKKQVSGFNEWDQKPHALDYLIYPENMTEDLSIDEICLSNGELYTIVTNKKLKNKNKQCLVAIINGTDSETIENVLKKLPQEKRNQVREISLDMARNMSSAARKCFCKAQLVIDRFHVVKLVLDAMQHVRVKIRWSVIKAENKSIEKMKKKGKKFKPRVLPNGDTIKELLARSRYLLYKKEDEWTINQSNRAAILFAMFPTIKKAYKLALEFRSIYNNKYKEKAEAHFEEWKEKVKNSGIEEFNSTMNSLEYHLVEILNFFKNKSTNGYAESFNSKIKAFRANLKGVSDVEFFLFRLQKLFA